MPEAGYTASRIKKILQELNITPYKTDRVDGHQAATILTWRLKEEYQIEKKYTTTALRRRVDTGALPIAEQVNRRFNLYNVHDVFALSLVPQRAEGAKHRISKENALTIQLVEPADPQVARALEVVSSISPRSSWRLFRQEALCHAICVALAFQEHDTIPVGIGTLSVGDTFKDPPLPEIAGVWVHPDHRQHHIGWKITAALIDESRHRFPKEQIVLFGLSAGGRALVNKARKEQGEVILAAWGGGSGEEDFD